MSATERSTYHIVAEESEQFLLALVALLDVEKVLGHRDVLGAAWH